MMIPLLPTSLVVFVACLLLVLTPTTFGTEEATNEVSTVSSHHVRNVNTVTSQNILAKKDRHLAAVSTDTSTAVEGNLFLRLFRRTAYCRPVQGQAPQREIYETIEAINLFRFFYRNDVKGRCGDVCADICNHQACRADFITPDDSLCECYNNNNNVTTVTPCGTNAVCSNISETCQCQPGYSGNALTSCTDINECTSTSTNATTSACGPNSASCTNTEGSYTCTCKVGFKPGNGTCVSADTCSVSQPCPVPFFCGQRSRSDPTAVCCNKTVSCGTGGNEICCVGSYQLGDECPSQLDVDCVDPLECGRTSILNPTYICCRRTIRGPFGTEKICV